jgi:uncharacterized protein (DUF58 family)
MNAQIKDLLNPEILNSISGMELIARVIVEGFMSGSNKSKSVGAGQEFSQYRSYEPGDDIRQLDWKIYARSERYYIRQADIETNITVKFMIDASGSMSYKENQISKLQYAKILTAALGYLARKQSDSFGLFTINNKSLHVVRPRFEQQQFIRFINELIKVEAEGTWTPVKNLEHLFDHHGKEMIIFMTDLYEAEKDLLSFIARLKTPRNEVIVFHIMGDQEIDLDFEGSFVFQDLETSSSVRVDTALMRKQYAERVAEWMSQTRLWLHERQVNYQLIRLSDPFENSLHNFLRVRKTIAY